VSYRGIGRGAPPKNSIESDTSRRIDQIPATVFINQYGKPSLNAFAE
jgi:hypothetical protein